MKNKKSFIGSRHFILLGVVFVCLLIGSIIIYKSTSQERQVAETPENEMTKLPPDVKKRLTRIPVTTSSATFRVPILMYHYVEYVQDKRDTIRQKLDINPYIFEQQVKTLKDAGYTFMTAKELGEVLDSKRSLPQKPILLTFDDGHWDFDTVVLPILKKYHIKATSYVIPGFIGGSDFMTPQELQDVINSGLIDVGAHTVHHISLKGKLYPIVKYEVDESKEMLEQEFHIHVVSFAYPYGTFDQQTINIVRQAGFTTALSTIPGIEQSRQNRFFLYRLRPGYRVGGVLLQYLQRNMFKAW